MNVDIDVAIKEQVQVHVEVDESIKASNVEREVYVHVDLESYSEAASTIEAECEFIVQV